MTTPDRIRKPRSPASYAGSGVLLDASEYTSSPNPTMASMTRPAPNNATRTRMGIAYALRKT